MMQTSICPAPQPSLYTPYQQPMCPVSTATVGCYPKHLHSAAEYSKSIKPSAKRISVIDTGVPGPKVLGTDDQLCSPEFITARQQLAVKIAKVVNEATEHFGAPPSAALEQTVQLMSADELEDVKKQLGIEAHNLHVIRKADGVILINEEALIKFDFHNNEPRFRAKLSPESITQLNAAMFATIAEPFAAQRKLAATKQNLAQTERWTPTEAAQSFSDWLYYALVNIGTEKTNVLKHQAPTYLDIRADDLSHFARLARSSGLDLTSFLQVSNQRSQADNAIKRLIKPEDKITKMVSIYSLIRFGQLLGEYLAVEPARPRNYIIDRVNSVDVAAISDSEKLVVATWRPREGKIVINTNALHHLSDYALLHELTHAASSELMRYPTISKSETDAVIRKAARLLKAQSEAEKTLIEKCSSEFISDSFFIVSEIANEWICFDLLRENWESKELPNSLPYIIKDAKTHLFQSKQSIDDKLLELIKSEYLQAFVKYTHSAELFERIVNRLGKQQALAKFFDMPYTKKPDEVVVDKVNWQRAAIQILRACLTINQDAKAIHLNTSNPTSLLANHPSIAKRQSIQFVKDKIAPKLEKHRGELVSKAIETGLATLVTATFAIYVLYHLMNNQARQQ